MHFLWFRNGSALAGVSVCAVLMAGCASSQVADREAEKIGPLVRMVPSGPAGKSTVDESQFTLVTYQEETDKEPPDKSPAEATENEQDRQSEEGTKQESPPTPELNAPIVADSQVGPISVTDVAESIHATFPLLEVAWQELQVAEGKQVAAWGAFDTKLKATSENGPLGFYETYRNSAGFSQPIYKGGEVFGGYRVGRGNFQPWYQERQTNDGGEFKAGVRVPLLRNRQIDARRAELWRATYDRERVRPEIQAQLIQFVRDGSVFYWNWVAAGRKYEIGKNALELAVKRNAGLKRKVELGETDPPLLQDNLRAIAKREAKLIELRRKLEQSAIKLSLFYRTSDGQPLIADESQLVDFPEPQLVDNTRTALDIVAALEQRPELVALDAVMRRVNVDLSEARNDMLPAIDAQLVGSQDLGAPTSKKRDKSELEVELGLFVDVPLQRRKAIGKSQAAQAKLAQLSAKRRFTEDKIRAEVQSAATALTAAYNRLSKAKESRRLADFMVGVEERKVREGASDLLSLLLREQYAIEAAEAEVDALLDYFSAKADYDAALAREWPTQEVIE